ASGPTAGPPPPPTRSLRDPPRRRPTFGRGTGRTRRAGRLRAVDERQPAPFRGTAFVQAPPLRTDVRSPARRPGGDGAEPAGDEVIAPREFARRSGSACAAK